MRRYGEEKSGNVRLARELLDKIAQRQDTPFFFDVDEEDQELKIEEKRLAEAEKERQRLKKLRHDYDDLRAYVRTASTNQATRAIGRFQKAYPNFEDVKQLRKQITIAQIKTILPEPFDWVNIPVGKVTLLNDYDKNDSVYLKKDQPQTFDVPAFAMAKYPITNTQYAKFMHAGGYQDRRWWTDAGWEQRKNSNGQNLVTGTMTDLKVINNLLWGCHGMRQWHFVSG
jgi:formylglycine-generating enzyme required for sulfatase activity